jgi:SAM-dependent methyltransferase
MISSEEIREEHMCSSNRYEEERSFTDTAAEKALALLPPNLRIKHMGSFEELCKQIPYLQSASDFLGDMSGKKVLEMGCGNGWICLRLAKSGARVWGCDISPKTIELAQRYAQAAGLDIQFDVMACEEMSYEDNFFDCVFMHMALHHCDIPAVSDQILRVLKPGGKAVLVEDYAYHPLLRLYRFLTPNRHTSHEKALTDEDLRRIVSNFSSFTIEYHGLLNLFATSQRKELRSLGRLLQDFDSFLYAHFDFLARYSRLLTIRLVK